MRKFRLKEGASGYAEKYVVGSIYTENERPHAYTVASMVEEYPEDWEEVFEDVVTPKFKVGDEVIVTSWNHAKIKLPQKGVIKGINPLPPTSYKILLEEDHYGKEDVWFFKDGQFELVGDVDNFTSWLDEKIVNLISLDIDTGKLQEVKRIYQLYLDSLK